MQKGHLRVLFNDFEEFQRVYVEGHAKLEVVNERKVTTDDFPGLLMFLGWTQACWTLACKTKLFLETIARGYRRTIFDLVADGDFFVRGYVVDGV